MIFSRQKKLQRDRNAGCVFCWRGGQGGNRGGLLLAILFASGLFAFAFWGISLDFKSSKPQTRKFAKILLLDELSTEMALWVDQNSPFPSRWDPKSDKNHQIRVEDALEVTFQTMTEPPSPWREMPTVQVPVTVPKLIEPGIVELGSLPKLKKTAQKPSVVELVITLKALGAFSQREPRFISAMNIPIPQQAYGSALRFALAINPAGDVVYCAPVEWGESSYAKNIENWLRVQKFKPITGDALEVGEVSINVEVKNHARN